MKVSVASVLMAAKQIAYLVARYMVFSWNMGRQIVNLEEKALQFAPKAFSFWEGVHSSIGGWECGVMVKGGMPLFI